MKYKDFEGERDEKALKLLKKYYRGGKLYGKQTEEEFEYCKKHGVMFDPYEMAHDDAVKEVKRLSESILLEDVAVAFLYSLSTNDKQYRTALGSYVYAKSIHTHSSRLVTYRGVKKFCEVCGWCEGDFYRNKMSYQRFFGDTHDLGDIINALHDLQEFIKLPKVNYCEKDLFILNRIFGLATRLNTGNKIIALQKLIKKEKVLDTTKTDIDTILGILGMCGIFQTNEHTGYLSEFTDNCNREFEKECDLYYPICHWKGKFGVNYEAVKQVFGTIVGEKLDEDKQIPFDENNNEIMEDSIKIRRKSKAEAYFEDGKFFVSFKPGERKYFAINEIDPAWDTLTMYSNEYVYHKRTIFYFEGDMIKKIIYEEGYELEDKTFCIKSYTEADTEIYTRGRRFILPKTERGSEQNLTPSSAIDDRFLHCVFKFGPKLPKEEAYMCSYNIKNGKELRYLGIENLKDDEDFRVFAENYISTCDKDYFNIINEIKNAEHVTVKFGAGDIFRMRIDRNYFAYALIIGKIRHLEKWNKIPKEHVFRGQMTQPILFRFYDMVTDNPDLKKEDLQDIELFPMEMVQDNEIIWGTCPIIDSKKLIEADIDLPFYILKPGKYSDNDKVTVKWGTAQALFEVEEVPLLLDAKNRLYATGVALAGSARYLLSKHGLMDGKYYKRFCEIDESDKWKKKLIEYLGEDESFTVDDFARRFGGITRKEFIEYVQGEHNTKHSK